MPMPAVSTLRPASLSDWSRRAYAWLSVRRRRIGGARIGANAGAQRAGQVYARSLLPALPRSDQRGDRDDRTWGSSTYGDHDRGSCLLSLTGLLIAFLLVVQQRGKHDGRWDTIDRRTGMRGV